MSDGMGPADFVGWGVALALGWYAKSQSKDAKLLAENADLRAESAGLRDKQRTEREEREAAEKEHAKKLRLWMFAHEALELHRRWFLYATQALDGNGISMSRPFEWIEFSTIEEFLRVGGAKDVVAAVYRVKQLNRQMDLQVVNAQASVRTNSPQVQADLRLVYGFLYNEDEWPAVCGAIRLLVKAASDAGHVLTAESEAFEERCARGDKVFHSLNLRKS